MQLIPKRTGTSNALSVSSAIAATLCVSPLWYALAFSQTSSEANSQPAASTLTHVADSNTIPFEPPIVYPGYDPNSKAFQVESPRENVLGTRRSAISRDLMFRPEDRRTFKALHPFLLKAPAPLVVKTPKVPDAK